MTRVRAKQLEEQSRPSGRRDPYSRTALTGKRLHNRDHFVIERFNRRQRHVHDITY